MEGEVTRRIDPKLATFLRDGTQDDYWQRDGWWASLVVELYLFVEAYGYRITTLRFHQAGNFIRYTGPRGSIVFYYEPESTGDFGVTLELNDGSPRSIDSLIDGPPHSPAPSKLPLDLESVDRNLRYWAQELRTRAMSLLSRRANLAGANCSWFRRNSG